MIIDCQSTKIIEFVNCLEELSTHKDGFDSYNKTTIAPNQIAIQLGYRALGLCILHGILPAKIVSDRYEGGIIFYFNGGHSVGLHNDADIVIVIDERREALDYIIKLIHFNELPDFLCSVKLRLAT